MVVQINFDKILFFWYRIGEFFLVGNLLIMAVELIFAPDYLAELLNRHRLLFAAYFGLMGFFMAYLITMMHRHHQQEFFQKILDEGEDENGR